MPFAPASPSRISVADQRRAASILDKFNVANAKEAMEVARPFAYGAGTLVLATALDGFKEGMGWEYPAFMRDTFFGKIDWRVYATALTAGTYMLLDESDYEDYQIDVAAVGVGFLGSFVMAQLWGGPQAWGEKFGGWVHSKVAKTPAAISAPDLAARQASAKAQALAAGKTEAEAAAAAAAVTGIEVGAADKHSARMKRLQKALDNAAKKDPAAVDAVIAHEHQTLHPVNQGGGRPQQVIIEQVAPPRAPMMMGGRYHPMPQHAQHAQ